MPKTEEERKEYQRQAARRSRARKKNKTQVDTDEEWTPSHPDVVKPMDEAVELTLEMPEPTTVKPMTIGEKSKSWMDDFLKLPDEPAKVQVLPTRRGKQKFFRAKSEIITVSIVTILETLLPAYDVEYKHEGVVIRILPSQEQTAAIVNPLLNILDRHANVGAIHPDAEDVIDSITALIAYGWETRMSLKLIAQIKAMEFYREQQKAKNNSTLEGMSESNGPVVVY